ncbi:MAG: holin [Oscillospiraceae bacterium]|nr:holin [Oscillospiraceae bacterium]
MTKNWWKAALIRAARTFAQGLVTLIGSEAINIVDLNWPKMLGMAATMALVSLLTSIGGLPEVVDE